MRVLEYIVLHPWKTLTILVAGTLLGLGAFYAQQVSAALGEVAVEDFNPEEARSAIEAPDEPNGPPPSTAFDFGEPAYDLDGEMALIEARLAELPDQATFNVSAFGEPVPDAVRRLCTDHGEPAP